MEAIDQKQDRFWGVYAAYFGPLSERQGINEWNDLIRKSDIDDLCEAVRNLGNQEQKTQRKPRLGEIKRAYWSIRTRGRNDWDKRHQGECGYCLNFGYVDVVSVGEIAGNSRLIRRGEGPDPGEGVWISQVQCICTKGLRINGRLLNKNTGYGMDRDAHDRIVKECGHIPGEAEAVRDRQNDALMAAREGTK